MHKKGQHQQDLHRELQRGWANLLNGARGRLVHLRGIAVQRSGKEQVRHENVSIVSAHNIEASCACLLI